ncbi:hypothetical protein C7E12_07325, partial [Stenotrophomonas maltophilia]
MGTRPRQDRAMQQYLLLIYIEPALLQALPTEEFNALMRDCLAHADKLQAEGTLLAAQKLRDHGHPPPPGPRHAAVPASDLHRACPAAGPAH